MANITINESLNEYYKLKNNYQLEINKEKKKIIKNPELSWKEKRNEFKKYKPKCINCKRPVGTIFSIKYNTSNEFRELKAICGNLTEPCNLNININPGVTFNVLEHIKELEKDNTEYKNEIIDDKNKLLFGYISSENAIANFDKLKDAINDLIFLLNMNYETLFQVIDNKNTKETLQKTEEEIFILINQIKQSIKDYNKTNDLQLVRDSVELYNTQLEPKLRELMFLKYRTNLVEFNEEENTYSLIQKPYTILDLEDNFVKPEVISFDFGTIVKSKKKTGTKKETSKKKLIIEDEEIQEEQPEMETTTVRPRIQGDGTIIWDDADYAKLWERLPFAYKNALAMDREWLQESMDKYIQNRKNKKPSTFVAPSNLILPPQILEDGSYDFGNAIYNKYFNKLDNNYKKTLLTLFTEEDGMKSYKPLLTTLSNIIGGELGFREFF